MTDWQSNRTVIKEFCLIFANTNNNQTIFFYQITFKRKSNIENGKKKQ